MNDPREHCGHLSPETGLSAIRTECVLRPGHSGSHADDVGCRWWPIAEQPAVSSAGPAPATDRDTQLSDVERQFLTYALDLAADQMASRGDEFGLNDEAAMERLRRLAGEAQQDPTQDRPRRGDAFEAWLKAQRDEYHQTTSPQWLALDEVLDAYRLHADTGTPLPEHVCEGRVVGDCECLEQPAAGARSGQPETEA